MNGFSRIIMVVFLSAALMPPVFVWAGNDIRRIEHADGRVEYTNLVGETKGVSVSGQRSSGHTSIYKYRQANGVLTFSDQKPHDQPYEIVKVDCHACDPHSQINWRNTRLNLTAYTEAINRAAKAHAVDPALVRALIHAESSFDAGAVSSKGAQGLMQLMPATAAELGVEDTLNAEQNIGGGVKYLANLLEAFEGNTRLALAAYNAGAASVRRYGGIPPFAETRVYVERVTLLQQRYQREIKPL